MFFLDLDLNLRFKFEVLAVFTARKLDCFAWLGFSLFCS